MSAWECSDNYWTHRSNPYVLPARRT